MYSCAMIAGAGKTHVGHIPRSVALLESNMYMTLDTPTYFPVGQNNNNNKQKQNKYKPTKTKNNTVIIKFRYFFVGKLMNNNYMNKTNTYCLPSILLFKTVYVPSVIVTSTNAVTEGR